MKPLSLLLAALAFATAAAAPTTFTMPKLTAPPTLDGTVKTGEYNNSVKLYGLNAYNSSFFNDRQAEQYFAVDSKYFYWAMKSELPPAGMQLLNRIRKKNGPVFLDDNNEFLIIPPGGKFVYHLIVNFIGTTFTIKYPIINGEKGHIEIPETHSGHECLIFDNNRNLIEHFKAEYPEDNGFVYQVEEVINCINSGKIESDIMPAADTIECARIFDKLLEN